VAPPQRTEELEMKFDPLTVKVNAASPAVALEGEIEAMLGVGFWVVVVEEDPPPPQFVSGKASAQINPMATNRRDPFPRLCRLRSASV
jgi:hypothetical protein